MMKTKLKFFLVLLAFVVGGVNIVWAERVGATDYSNNWENIANSTLKTLTSGKKLHYEFTLHTPGTTNNQIWLLKIVNTAESTFVLQGNTWWFCGDNNPDNTFDKVASFTNNYTWDNFASDMNGASVTVDVMYAGWWIIVRASTTNNGRTYVETLKLSHNPDIRPEIGVMLSVVNAYIDITSDAVTDNTAEFYDFTSAGSLNSRFVGVGGGTSGSWNLVSGKGYYNGTSGTRQFQISGLHNGDQVIVTYTGTTATFNSANVKNNSGEFISTGSIMTSDEAFYMTADGILELNIPRNLYIESVEINKEWTGSVTPTITLTSPSSSSVNLTVGQTSETAVSTTPTKATPVYTSSNTSVATVDRYGHVTAVGIGTATITASLTVNGTSAAPVSYTVNVNSATLITYNYDFQQFSTNPDTSIDLPTNGTITINGSQKPRLAASSMATNGYVYTGETPDPGIEFAVDPDVGATNGWALHRSSGSGNTQGLFNGNTSGSSTNRNLYIANLQNGDKIRISFYYGAGDAVRAVNPIKLRKKVSDTYTDLVHLENLTSDEEYTVTSDGILTLLLRQGVYIKSINVQREGSPALWFSGSPFSYELTDLNFTEPTLTTQPAGLGVTYSSSNTAIAKTGSEDGGPGDILFIRPGNVIITATAVIDGTTYTASYNILVKASDALFIATNDNTAEFPLNNPYSNLDNTGVLAVNATTFTSVPFITMEFGNGSDVVLARDFSNEADYHSSMILDADGIQHMNYTPTTESEVTRMRPTSGTYYVFRPVIDGNLTIRGVRRTKLVNNVETAVNNTVVLVDASSTGGSTTTYSTYTSYPIVKEYQSSDFTGNKLNENISVPLTAGHTYYLYGNNNLTNGGERQVFYLHGFTYATNFNFASKAVVLGSTANAANHVTHIDVSSNNQYITRIDGTIVDYVGQQVGNHSSGPTYTMVFKTKDGVETNVNNKINSSTGAITGIDLSVPGTYIITATYSSYKTYYGLTVPYTLASNSKDIITWKFNNDSEIETQSQLNANATDWKTYYKVRLYDKKTRALTYINVPVRSNGVSINGDNARYIDKTAGLLFKANAQDFGTTTDEPVDATLEAKLTHDPTTLTNNRYVTISNGTSMTIPNLKAGQHVSVKWSRYSEYHGDLMSVSNLSDLNGTPINTTFTIGAGGRVQDKGGNGYHEFIVTADGDVTFTLSEDGWANIYEINVANDFIPTELRLQTVDATASAGTRGSALTFIHKASGGDDIIEEYSTNTGRIHSQSNLDITYYIKNNTRTGTLNTSNCAIDGNHILTVHGGNTSGTTSGHGRFTLVQEGRVNGTNILLDRNEYEIKVYEYNYGTVRHPYTWNMENISSATGTSLSGDLSKSTPCWKQTTAQAEANQYQLTLEPENMITWEYRNSSGAETAVSELNGLGIRPADISANNNIVFSTNSVGVELSGSTGSLENPTPSPQIFTVPSVASGETVYLRILKGSNPTIEANVDLTEVYTSGSYAVYKANGSGDGLDVDFTLNNVTVLQAAVSTDTKTITAAGYATEARAYPLDFTLANTFGVNNDVSGVDQKAYIVTGVNSSTVTPVEVSYVPTGAGVMMGSGVTSETVWPLFTTDVNRTTDVATNAVVRTDNGSGYSYTTVNMSENKLIGVVSQPNEDVDQTTVIGDKTYYNYILSNGGYVQKRTNDNWTVDMNDEINEVGFYLVIKKGTSLSSGGSYPDYYGPRAHSAYLRLDEELAEHKGVGTSTSGAEARSYFLLNFADDETGMQQTIPTTIRTNGQNDAYYTLQGVRVDKPGKGLYIHKGKKISIK